jgi:hypothetical protein
MLIPSYELDVFTPPSNGVDGCVEHCLRLCGDAGTGGGNFIVPVLNWMGLDAKVAAGTTAVVVVFASLSGFLGHATMGRLDPAFVGVMALAAAAGSIVGSRLMTTRISSAQLKRIIGVLLWLIAAKMIFDLL